MNGDIAGGFVRGRAQVRLNELERNFFSLVIEDADAKRLLRVIPAATGNAGAAFTGDSQELPLKLTGPVTIALRGQVGRAMRGSGSLSLTRGTISGVNVNDLLIPFHWATLPGGYGQLKVRDAKMNAGTGIAEGNLTLLWGVETTVDGLVKVTNVPVRTLVPHLGDYGLIGNGRITGRFEVGGRNVHSVDDLTGRLIATLGNTSPREIPIIQQTVPFLNTLGLVKPFDRGDIRASLSRGIVRVQRLALYSPSAQLFRGRQHFDVRSSGHERNRPHRHHRSGGAGFPVAGVATPGSWPDPTHPSAKRGGCPLQSHRAAFHHRNDQ